MSFTYPGDCVVTFIENTSRFPYFFKQEGNIRMEIFIKTFKKIIKIRVELNEVKGA